MPSTFSDPYVRFALGAGLTALAMTVGLMAVIVCLRLRLRRDVRRETAFTTRWRPLLMETVSGAVPEKLPAVRPNERLFFLKLWNYLQESLRGSASDSLNALACQLRFDAVARDFLNAGNRAERLLAILTLGHLRDQASWEALAIEATRADSLSSIHAAKALLKIDAWRATERLLPQLFKRHDWGTTQVASILGEARPAFESHLVKHFLGIKKKHWLRALQLADALRLELPLNHMLRILPGCESVEALVVALRIAAGPELLPAVRRYQSHADWRVRVEVASFLSRYGGEGDLPALQALLRDPQWWVRYQAAQSLAGMPFFGREQIVRLRAETTDSLAISMLDHVLAENAAAA